MMDEAQKRRVLVVDDNADTVDALAMLLRLLGYEAEVAHGGKQAIDVADSFDPHVVLLDIALPDISGYEVARLLRERQPGRYIVAATGFATDADRDRAISAGCDAHLAKPMSTQEIRDMLKQSER